jgi:glycosyltransferase involved in cell wall biosynthesis
MREHTAGVIASCRTVRDFYTGGFGMDPDRIPVINGGVDSDFFTAGHPRNTLRESLDLPADGFVFGLIGRFSPVKGHTFFFEAARRVLNVFPDAWFVVAGWDAQFNREIMMEMAEAAGIIERIRFTGRQNDVRDLIASVDAGVIASIGSETVCRIAMEYMAMGVPVVASDTNVIPEVIRHNHTGFIVPAADPEAMAYGMERLLASRERTESLGKNGRETVEREYSLTRFAEKTLEAYRNMSIHV